MRSLVLRHRIRSLSRTAAAALIAGAVAGCSSDFSRFDTGLKTASVEQSAVNPYPGVDQNVTGSVGNNGAPLPRNEVQKDPGPPDHLGYDPNADQAQTYQTAQTGGGIQRAELPKLEQQAGHVVHDPVRTNSVANSGAQTNQIAKAAVEEKGWTRNGGTVVTLREGETLYNLSKRYGVPVSALMQANNIANADRVQAGQQIVVPAYVHGAGIGVSAPDNDPKTQRASAGRGLAETAKKDTSLPERKPVQVARTQRQAADERQVASRTDRDDVDPIVTGKADAASQEKSQLESALAAKSDDSAPQRTGIGVFRWPVRGRIISNFGDATASGKNDGIDISVPEGTAVKAVENGVVVYAGNELQGLGNLVLVQHADGWVSAYAHNREIDVKRGDEVRRGEILARSGRSGNAETPKLHFELRRNSKPVDPVRYLDGA